MVLSGPQDPEAYAALLRITGLTAERMEELYWVDRNAYDEGKLTGFGFWQKFVADAGLDLKQAGIEELNRWDVQMWSTQNDAMVAWQQKLKQRGLLDCHPLKHGGQRACEHRAGVRLALAI